MEAVYGEWKNTVGNYTNELGVLTEGYTNVSMQEAEATAKAAQAQQDFSNLVAAERNQSDLIEEARNLTNITSTPSFLTAADSVTFRNNMTEETINKQLVAEIGNGTSIGKHYNLFTNSLALLLLIKAIRSGIEL